MKHHLGTILWIAAVLAVLAGLGVAGPVEDADLSSAVLVGKPSRDAGGNGKAWGRSEAEPSPSPTASPAPEQPAGNPFTGAALYVDPRSDARREADVLRADDPERAALFDRIGDHAQADWFGDWNPTSDVRAQVAGRVDAIREVGALPVLVTYAIPARDCGGYSAGGTGSPEAYRAWIREFAAGLGGRPAAVILEPDALAQMTTSCLGSSAAVDERAAMLAEAVRTLAAAGADVYLDAGNSNWLGVAEAAERLRRAGIAAARGFALNVSNYRTTSESVDYGRAVSDAVGGAPFVVDTSRNGLGPTPDAQWCNPDGRALGDRPAADPITGVDAYLWIKRPGESDGECNGGPRAGAWWPEYAEGLASRASW